LACMVHDADGRVSSSRDTWDPFDVDHSAGVHEH
jgi:hypothetical protein